MTTLSLALFLLSSLLVDHGETSESTNVCHYCTFTQGGYKNDCNKKPNSWFGGPPTCSSLTLDWANTPPGCLRDLCFVANTSVVLGNTSNGGFTTTFTSGAAIKAFLPEGGPPSVFTTPNVVNPTESPAGVLSAQLLTAMLNVRFSANLSNLSLLVFSANCNNSNLSPLFYGKNILEVIYIANQVISGAAGPEYAAYTPSLLNQALSLYNDNFDKCQNLYPTCFACTPETGAPTTTGKISLSLSLSSFLKKPDSS